MGPLGPCLTAAAPFTRYAHYAGVAASGFLTGMGEYRRSALVAAASLATYAVTQPSHPRTHILPEQVFAADSHRERVVRVLNQNVLTTNETGARGFADYAASVDADVVVVVESTSPMMVSELEKLAELYEHAYVSNPESPEAVAVFSRFPFRGVE